MHESVECVKSNGLTSSQVQDQNEVSNAAGHDDRSSTTGISSSSSPNTRTTSGCSSDDSSSRRELTQYEAHLARQLLALKDGAPSDIISPRRQRQFIDDNRKDAAYWERRRKNNEAAKRSREKRRMNDMAMESQISKVQHDLDSLRNELVLIKRHYGLNPDRPFIPVSTSSDEQIPSSDSKSTILRPPVTSSSPISLLPAGAQHIPMMIDPHNPTRRVALMPRLMRPMLQMPTLHSNLHLMSQHSLQSYSGSEYSRPSTPRPSSTDSQSCWLAHSNMRLSSKTSAELAYRQDENVMERSSEFRSAEDSNFQTSDEGAFLGPSSTGNSRCRTVEQDSPLDLVMKPLLMNEGKRRMDAELENRYQEIKAGSVENRDSGVVSPGGSTSSTSSGSPYSKRLRVDESDSMVEAESISTGNENTSSESVSPSSQCAMDTKYNERRKRNNEASRRSREVRKQIAKTREEKTDVLEMENTKLRKELNSLASEVSNLRQMIVAKHAINCESENSPQAGRSCENSSGSAVE